MTDARRILVVDDGGFPTIKPDFTGQPISLDPYERLLALAERHDLTIPIAVTASFIDVNNIAGLDSPGDQADRLVRFLLGHQQRLPVWNHGLTHRYMDEFSEFAVYDGKQQVPEAIQEARLQQSQAVFDDLGFVRPKVFVPPAHAWEPGVTDRIAKDTGIEAIAIREFEKRPLTEWVFKPHRPYLHEWQTSKFLTTFFRAGLGIPFDRTRLGRLDYLKARQYIRPSNVASRYVIWRRTAPPLPLDHYFAHVQNLIDPGSEAWWDKIIVMLKHEFTR